MSSLTALRQVSDAEIISIISAIGDAQKDLAVIARKKLLFDLLQAGVRPFTDASVAKYQNQKVALTEGFMKFSGFLNPDFNDALTGDEASPYLTRLAVMAGGGAGLSICAFHGSLLEVLIAGGVGAVLGAVATLGLFRFGAFLYYRYYHSFWRTTSLEQFRTDPRREVPSHVEDLAKRIAKARPDVGFMVEYFQLDPFLTICHPEHDVGFRVAVWDERGYKVARL